MGGLCERVRGTEKAWDLRKWNGFGFCLLCEFVVLVVVLVCIWFWVCSERMWLSRVDV